MYKKRTNTWHEYADFILLELISLNIAFILSYCIRHGWSVIPYELPDYLMLIAIASAFDILIAVFFNSFVGVLKKGYYKEFMSSLKHVLMVFAAVTLYLFSVQESATYSRIALFLMFGMDFAFGYVFRMLYKHTRKARTTHQRSILILAPSSEFSKITDGINSDEDNGVFICGYVDIENRINDIETVDNESSKVDYSAHQGKRKIKGNVAFDQVASKDTIVEYVCREWVDEILIKTPKTVGLKVAKNDDKYPEKTDIETLIKKFMEMGVTVHVVMDDFESVEGRQMVETVAGMTVVTSSIKTASAGQLLLKRLMDIIGGLIGCVLTVIIGTIIAPFILIRSPGHLIFRQTRIGMNGKKFKMLKFRSMIKNAEAKKAELMAQNTVSDNMMFKLDWDPRIIGNRITKDGKKKTGIGEFIRKTSIDELPQFFNVLIGDMSLVGTRPPTVDEWEKYDLHHRARLAVRPGITGMWQVSGRSDIKDFEEVVKLDTEYIYNWSIGMDLRILIKTFGAVLKGRGAK